MTAAIAAFQTAFAHHQAGRLREAEHLYRQVLSGEPGHAEAWHLLGLVAYQGGRWQEAVELIERAIDVGGQRALFAANLGEAYRAAGRLDEARDTLARALALDPNQPDAHNSLGLVYRGLDRPVEAIESLGRALALRPDFAAAHHNLGALLFSQQRLAEAEAACRRALQLKPDYVEAQLNLAAICEALGRFDEAEACCAAAQRQAPADPAVLVRWGSLHQARDQRERAMACYRQAVALDPRCVAGHANLGGLLMDEKRHVEAAASFRRALDLEPEAAEAHFNLGLALHALEDWDAAAAAYAAAVQRDATHAKALVSLAMVRQHQSCPNDALALLERAIELDPHLAKARLQRGNVYKLLGRQSEAVAEYQAAIRLQPEHPEAYNNLAVLFTEIDQPDAAVESCRRGLEQDPSAAALHANLATALQNLGRADEALAEARHSVALRPEGVGEFSNLLYKLNFHPRCRAEVIFDEHLAWARRHAEPLTAAAAPHANDRSADRRLRVGYVSPYFREHAVNFFTEPILTHHDHVGFEVFAYSDVARPDAVSDRIRAHVDTWRETLPLSDAELAELVRRDRIDILVDLTGHIAGSRLLAFARKPAPVQVTYIGYQNTTGMSAMDYRLTDEWSDPPDATDGLHTERLYRLGGAFCCYRPSDDCPDVAPLPSARQGYTTFGAMNNFAKVTPEVLEAWLAILRRLPGARLLLLARGQGYIERSLSERARQQGIDPQRIEYCPKRPRPQYLELYRRIDIALDPFPFVGHTTTCDALWMGVPVVMQVGATYASRFGGSMLRQVGLDDWITTSTEDYIERAVAAAADRVTLEELRGTLRGRMAASPLLDHRGFTRGLEAAYRTMWRRWCQREHN